MLQTLWNVGRFDEERTPVPRHPEVLEATAKAKAKGISELRIVVTLDALPDELLQGR